MTTSRNGLQCPCGMPNMWGVPWPVWHRLHLRQHLHAFPNLDVRSRRALTELAEENTQ